jgi:hypothetical protein
MPNIKSSLSRLALPAFGLFLLAGCAEPRPANTTNKFDGQYAGAYTFTGGENTCVKLPVPPTMSIRDGRMSLQYSPRELDVYFELYVLDSGVIDSQVTTHNGIIHLTGTIVGDTFTGATANPNCRYDIVMKRQ